MKKNLSRLLVVLLMATFLFPTIGNAADDHLTAQQKYDALAAKGIFAGMADGSNGLDQNMTRAQFARVSALILGLEDVSATDTHIVKEKPFSDVELGLWYTDEIAAAKKAGVFVGNADGTFNPRGDITVQELAVVVAGLLGLEKVEDAKIEGAADWAAGYVQAIINANVDFPTNYTEAAKRESLADLAYHVEEKKAEEEVKKKAEEEAKKKAEEEAKKELEEALKKLEEEKKKLEEQSWYPVTPPIQASTMTPTALPAAGAVTSGTPVTLTSATVSATLYYTTDLSEPTTLSTLYTGPINITSSTTIKAIAVNPGSTNSSVARFEYTVTIPIVLPGSISPLTEGQLYSGSIAKLSGGTGAITYAVTSGALPAGLTLDPSTGAISGTPSVSGVYDFTISATDSATATVTMQYTGTITPALSKTPLELINEAAASGVWDDIDISTFTLAGVLYIEPMHLWGYQYALQTSDLTPLPRTLSEIQEIVDETNQQIVVDEIYAYLNPFGGGSLPTVEVFDRAGITGVDASNLNDILDALISAYQDSKSNPFGTTMSTKQEIQDVVDNLS